MFFFYKEEKGAASAAGCVRRRVLFFCLFVSFFPPPPVAFLFDTHAPKQWRHTQPTKKNQSNEIKIKEMKTRKKKPNQLAMTQPPMETADVAYRLSARIDYRRAGDDMQMTVCKWVANANETGRCVAGPSSFQIERKSDLKKNSNRKKNDSNSGQPFAPEAYANDWTRMQMSAALFHEISFQLPFGFLGFFYSSVSFQFRVTQSFVAMFFFFL